MRIFQLVPNIRNPLQDTAEILKYTGLGTRLLSNPNNYGCRPCICIVRFVKLFAENLVPAGTMSVCNGFPEYDLYILYMAYSYEFSII